MSETLYPRRDLTFLPSYFLQPTAPRNRLSIYRVPAKCIPETQSAKRSSWGLSDLESLISQSEDREKN